MLSRHRRRRRFSCRYDHDNVMTTWLKDWPEYSYPLGAPVGDAEIVTTTTGGDDDSAAATVTTTYTRAFATGTTVFVNITVPPPSVASSLASTANLTSSADWGGGDGSGLGSQLTTTCIRWSNGATSGNGCDLLA